MSYCMSNWHLKRTGSYICNFSSSPFPVFVIVYAFYRAKALRASRLYSISCQSLGVSTHLHNVTLPGASNLLPLLSPIYHIWLDSDAPWMVSEQHTDWCLLRRLIYLCVKLPLFTFLCVKKHALPTDPWQRYINMILKWSYFKVWICHGIAPIVHLTLPYLVLLVSYPQ